MRRPMQIGRDTELTVRMSATMLLLAMVFVAFLGLLFWAGVPWFLVLVIAVAVAMFQYWGSDRIVLMTTGAREVSEQEEPWLHETIARLARAAEIPKPKKIAIMETHVPNAFATGRNPRNAVVAVTRGLLNRLTKAEVEAVLGHEMSHVKNRDVMVLTWASVIVIMAGFLMQMLFWMSLFGGFGGRRGGQGGGQAALIILAVYAGTILVYFISQMLIMTLSRYREYSADRGGAVLTGNPMQLASALAKISNDVYRIPEKDLRSVEHANAFFIIPALKGGGMTSMFSSHPPVEKRIEKLKAIERAMSRGATQYREFKF